MTCNILRLALYSFLLGLQFREAMAGIETLGLRVTVQPSPSSLPYAIVGGRSNARYWLIPLTNGKVAASSFALFQPLLTSARLLKLAACVLSLLGLKLNSNHAKRLLSEKVSHLKARSRIYSVKGHQKIIIILCEALTGRYSRFSNSLRVFSEILLLRDQAVQEDIKYDDIKMSCPCNDVVSIKRSL